MIRAFIAIEIPDEIKAKISDLQKRIFVDKCVRLTKSEQLHITINFLGLIEEKKLEEIKKLIEEIRINKKNVEVKNLGFFPSQSYQRVLYLSVYDTKDIATEVFSKIKFGELVDKGHITIARIKCKPSKNFLYSVEKEKDVYLGSFLVDKLAIFESILTSKGAIYRKIYEKSLE